MGDLFVFAGCRAFDDYSVEDIQGLSDASRSSKEFALDASGRYASSRVGQLAAHRCKVAFCPIDSACLSIKVGENNALYLRVKGGSADERPAREEIARAKRPPKGGRQEQRHRARCCRFYSTLARAFILLAY